MCIRDRIKGSLSKYMGISNVEKNTIHKKNEEYNVIPVSYTHLDVYKRQA